VRSISIPARGLNLQHPFGAVPMLAKDSVIAESSDNRNPRPAAALQSASTTHLDEKRVESPLWCCFWFLFAF
jgi:hypothetical protein